MLPRVLAMICLALCAVGAGLGADEKTEKKAAPPSAEALQKAEKTVKDLFKAEYAKTKTADRVMLATKLIEEADGTTDDPAAKFVLLREARDLAAKAGDAALAFRAVDALAAAFDVKVAAMKADALEVLAKGAIKMATAREIADAALAALDEAVASDDYDSAARIAKVAGTAAGRAGTAVANTVKARAKHVETAQKEFTRVKPFMAKLAEDANDSTAASEVGRFLCFYKGDWENGLPLLAKGKDEKLKVLAEKDLEMPATAAELAAVGDGWWDLGDKQPDGVRRILQLRAHVSYQKALPELTGLAKSKVQKREAEIEKMLERPADKSGWTVIFRSANAKLCGGDYNGGANNYAISIKRIPENVQYLRLWSAYKKDYVIVEMTKERLSGRSDDGQYGFQGRPDFRWKGWHLGVYSRDMPPKDKGDVVVSHVSRTDEFKGWGFGHRYYGDDYQAYSWAGKEIPASVFEIAVKCGPLTPAEEKKLLKKDK